LKEDGLSFHAFHFRSKMHAAPEKHFSHTSPSSIGGVTSRLATCAQFSFFFPGGFIGELIFFRFESP